MSELTSCVDRRNTFRTFATTFGAPCWPNAGMWDLNLESSAPLYIQAAVETHAAACFRLLVRSPLFKPRGRQRPSSFFTSSLDQLWWRFGGKGREPKMGNAGVFHILNCFFVVVFFLPWRHKSALSGRQRSPARIWSRSERKENIPSRSVGGGGGGRWLLAGRAQEFDSLIVLNVPC